MVDSATRVTASAFLKALVAAVPYRIHTVLIDNGIQFRLGAWHRAPLNPASTILWTNGQVERMNRTIKGATVKRFPYDNHDQLRRHLDDFVAAYNFARRLERVCGLTTYEFICKTWEAEPERFNANPHHQMPGLNT